ESIAPHLKAGTVVTDTTSTKADVMGWAKELLPSTVSFIGGHPMAGKTQSVEGAGADLFKDATGCVVPQVNADEAAGRTARGLVTGGGAERLSIRAVEHAPYVAGSRLPPCLMSVALMRSVSRGAGWGGMKCLGAGGSRDPSRLAAGCPEMDR